MHTLESLQGVKEDVSDLEQQLGNLRLEGLADKPPFPVSQLDAQYREIEHSSERLVHLQEDSKLTVDLLRAQALQESTQQARRLAQATQDNNLDPVAAGQLERALDHAQLQQRRAAEEKNLRTIENTINKQLQRREEVQLTIRQETAALMQLDTEFTDQQLKAFLAEVETLRVAAQKQLNTSRNLAEKLAASYKRYRQVTPQSSATSLQDRLYGQTANANQQASLLLAKKVAVAG